MNKIDSGSATSPEVRETSTVSTEPKEVSAYESLSRVQKQRADYLKRMLGDHAVELVKSIDSRGRNSWPIVYEKVMKLTQATLAEQTYQQAIYDNFELDKTYSSAEIISMIGEIRHDLKLVPYLSNTKQSCESDLFGMFIIKEVYELITSDGKSDSVRKLIGYKPVLRIKSEE